ncbi:MAG: hypothetical protein IKB00_01820, partial [Bacteroidaceae bacterium]|nr:hypothetical protein [Bacteroidaceae bacterium]
MNKLRIIRQWQALIIAIILSLLLIMLSCLSREHRNLDSVEYILEYDPVKADSILSSMPIPSAKQDHAWYAVLKTQAEYKNYMPITSDSLILTATEYYGTRHKSNHAAIAWYTQGCVYDELNNDVAAIEAYLKAKDLFPDTICRYYALTEQRLGKIYLSKRLFDESLSSFYNCRKIAETIKDSALIANSDYHISLIQLQYNHFDGLKDSFKELFENEYLSNYYK